MAKLEKVSIFQCQAEKPNGQGPFTLGGGHAMVRCRALPVVVLTERRKGKDGQRGAMSLCGSCFTVFQRQVPDWNHRCEDVAAWTKRNVKRARTSRATHD